MKKRWTFKDLASSIADYQGKYSQDVTEKSYFGFPLGVVLDSESKLRSAQPPSIAYLSMEFGLAPSIYHTFQISRPLDKRNHFFTHEVFSNYWLCDYLFKIQIDKMLDIPIYGGGLGVLAGDVIKSAADLGISFAGVGVLWNKGYFKQKFWYKHGQFPEEMTWDPSTYPGLVPLKNIISIETKEGPLYLRLWKYYMYSYDKSHCCPLILLDSNIDKNPDNFRKLTDQLYRSDDVWWRIFQRSILGIGAIKALDHLGYSIDCYHLNEGHAAYALLEKYIQLKDKTAMEKVKQSFVFTCHTPVAAGHDRFLKKDVEIILPKEYVEAAAKFGKDLDEPKLINLTQMSLENCQRVNAVAQKHGEVMRLQFPDFADKIDAVTNGIHVLTWISDSFASLFDKYLSPYGDWRRHPQIIEKVQELKDNRPFRNGLWQAHQANKINLINIVRRWRLKQNVLTIGWARRITGYKRPALLFHHISRIIELAYERGPLQIILAGKAHPNDDIGGAHIDEILDHIDELNKHRDVIKVLILENYDTYFGKLLTNSVDVWLNNPLPPFEASGTSGMKAVLNGVVQLSTLDGWVVEAADKDIGWIFGYQHHGTSIGRENQLRMDEDAAALCETLQQVMELYYDTNKNGEVNLDSPWIDKMVNCVSVSSFFNAQRMVEEYRSNMWTC